MFSLWKRMSRGEAANRSRSVLDAFSFVPRPARFDEDDNDQNENDANGPVSPDQFAPDEKSSPPEKPAPSAAKSREEKREGDAQADDDALSPIELKWFTQFIREPWLLTPDLMKATGLDRDANDHIRKKFEARGCLAFDTKVGAKHKLYSPTKRGLEIAARLGLPVGSTGKGSVGHEGIVFYTERSLREYFPQDRNEGVKFFRVGAASTVGGVQPDLLVIRADGSRFACQACHCNQPGYEAEAILKLHALTLLERDHADVLSMVLVVARNKTHKKAIEKAVKQRNDGNKPCNVTIMDFDTMLKVGWNEVFTD